MSEAIALAGRRPARPRLRAVAPYLLVLAAALALPLLGQDYWTVIATRAAIYWILVAGLNLVVGFAGQLAIGYVALLTLGAYTASVLVEKAGLDPSPPWPPPPWSAPPPASSSACPRFACAPSTSP